jgi:hypothetical protein
MSAISALHILIVMPLFQSSYRVKTTMKYLGSIQCRGTLTEGLVASALELECYEQKGGVITASGEIEVSHSALALFRGGAKVAFVTEDGHQLSLTLADSRTAPVGTIAQVVATGELPMVKDGSLGWFRPAPARAGAKAAAR